MNPYRLVFEEFTLQSDAKGRWYRLSSLSFTTLEARVRFFTYERNSSLSLKLYNAIRPASKWLDYVITYDYS